MNYNDVACSISDEIWDYTYKYGEYPRKIFMSKPLFRAFANHYNHSFCLSVNSYDKDRWAGCFEGIEVLAYESEKYEYYLAERKGGFRKYYE